MKNPDRIQRAMSTEIPFIKRIVSTKAFLEGFSRWNSGHNQKRSRNRFMGGPLIAAGGRVAHI
jgi:hypothetical protein